MDQFSQVSDGVLSQLRAATLTVDVVCWGANSVRVIFTCLGRASHRISEAGHRKRAKP